MDEDHVFALPKDPWTYGNGSFNPDLYSGPLNRGLRERRGSPTSRQRHTNPYLGEDMDGTHAVPPYHPGYDESQPSHAHFSRPPYADEDEDEDDHYYEDRPQRRRFIRRGSEGYEVRTIDREEMMKQYVESQSHLSSFAMAQRMVDQGEEGDNYPVSDEEDGNEGDGNRAGDLDGMEREVIRRMGEAGRYRPYVPEKWESEGDEDDEVERIPNGLPVRG